MMFTYFQILVSVDVVCYGVYIVTNIVATQVVPL